MSDKTPELKLKNNSGVFLFEALLNKIDKKKSKK